MALMDVERDEKRGPVSWYALRASLARPPIWLACWALVASLAVAGTLPWLHFFDEALAAYAPGSLLDSLSEPFRYDHRRELGVLESGAESGGAVLAFLAMLTGAFCAGGWLQVFLERTEGHSLRRFFFGGARFFWRFVRVLVMTIVILGVLSWLVYGKPWELVMHDFVLAIDDPEDLVSEASARKLQWFQHGLFAGLFAVVAVWGDYVRARLALHEARSALWAGLCTLFVLLKNPVRMLRPALLLFLAEWLVLWLVGIWAESINLSLGAGSSLKSVWFLLLLVQVAAVWRTIVRGAQLNAAVRVSRIVVEPPSRPDPWRNRIGGPGGPQYPLGGDDYGVSI